MGSTLSLCVSLVCSELPLLSLGHRAGPCLCHPSAGWFGDFLALT